MWNLVNLNLKTNWLNFLTVATRSFFAIYNFNGFFHLIIIGWSAQGILMKKNHQLPHYCHTMIRRHSGRRFYHEIFSVLLTAESAAFISLQRMEQCSGSPRAHKWYSLYFTFSDFIADITVLILTRKGLCSLQKEFKDLKLFYFYHFSWRALLIISLRNAV